jgi:hypothetical protein
MHQASIRVSKTQMSQIQLQQQVFLMKATCLCSQAKICIPTKEFKRLNQFTTITTAWWKSRISNQISFLHVTQKMSKKNAKLSKRICTILQRSYMASKLPVLCNSRSWISHLKALMIKSQPSRNSQNSETISVSSNWMNSFKIKWISRQIKMRRWNDEGKEK